MDSPGAQQICSCGVNLCPLWLQLPPYYTQDPYDPTLQVGSRAHWLLYAVPTLKFERFTVYYFVLTWAVRDRAFPSTVAKCHLESRTRQVSEGHKK